MKKSGIFLILFFIFLLSGCSSSELQKIAPRKDSTPTLTKEQQVEQQRKWEEEQQRQEQENQDAINS